MKTLLILMAGLTRFCPVSAQNSLEFFVRHAKENSPVLAENNNLIAIAQLEQKRLAKELTGHRV